MAKLSNTESLELELDNIAHEYDMVVVKEQNLTGNSYKILTQTDAYIYMLNQWYPTERMH